MVGIFTGGVVTAAAGALRTGSAYARFLDWSRAPDAVVAAEPYNPRDAPLSPAAVMRVPQAENAAVIKTMFAPGNIQFVSPASNAIPGQFNVSFALAQRTRVRAGDRLRLVMSTAGGRLVPLVFYVAGIDAAQSEF